MGWAPVPPASESPEFKHGSEIIASVGIPPKTKRKKFREMKNICLAEQEKKAKQI